VLSRCSPLPGGQQDSGINKVPIPWRAWCNEVAIENQLWLISRDISSGLSDGDLCESRGAANNRQMPLCGRAHSARPAIKAERRGPKTQVKQQHNLYSRRRRCRPAGALVFVGVPCSINITLLTELGRRLSSRTTTFLPSFPSVLRSRLVV
jgi:hypothetical protein